MESDSIETLFFSDQSSLTPLVVQQLIDVVGKVLAFDLWDQCKNSQIDIPKCEKAIRAARDSVIRKRYPAGETAAKLALEFQVTERTIYNIVYCRACAKAKENQVDMFDAI